MDEKRISKVQKFIESSADIERNVMPIMNKCIDGMAAAAQMIDYKQVREQTGVTIDRCDNEQVWQ